MRIGINAGHGPHDVRNFVQVDNLSECSEGQNNFRVYELIKKNLDQYEGVVVESIRPNMSDNPQISARGRFGDDKDLYIALHSNAGGGSGPVMFMRPDAPDDLVALATRMRDDIILELGFTAKPRANNFRTLDGVFRTSRGPGKSYYGELRYCSHPRAILVEMAFHDNPHDARLLRTRRESFADAITRAIVQHYGLKRITVGDITHVTSGTVNFRTGPGTSYPVIRNLPVGADVQLLPDTVPGNWSKAVHQADVGYISPGYLRPKYPVLQEMEKDVGKDETEVKTWLDRLGDPFNWCAAQVSYAYHKAGLLGQPGYSISTWAYVHAQELQELGRLYRYEDVKDKLTPDAVIFKNIDQSDDRIDHIAIFKRYNNDRSQMVTLGGNESQWSGQNRDPERRVRENFTSLTGPSLVYVGYPPHIELPQGVDAYSGYLATHLTPIPEPIPEPIQGEQDRINGPFVKDNTKLWFRAVAGSYNTRTVAERTVQELKDKGYRYAWLQAVTVEGQPWFRAHAGSHDRRGPAEGEVQKLINDGYKGAWMQATYTPIKEGI